jgi:hypothetical protein
MLVGKGCDGVRVLTGDASALSIRDAGVTDSEGSADGDGAETCSAIAGV